MCDVCADDYLRIVLFQLLNCSVYLVLIVVMAWRNFKMEQETVLVFSDIVTALAAAAVQPSSAAPPSSLHATSFFSLAPETVQRARELMMKCASHVPAVKREQPRHGLFYGYMHAAPLCSSVRDSCELLVACDDDDDCNNAGGDVERGCSLQDVYSVASALLQRLSLMEAAKSSAHHTIFGIAVDTALLLSTFSFAISGIASGLSTYGK